MSTARRVTCKFGGTSLADARCVQRVIDIIRSDPGRRWIVPSAPGKRDPKDRKITDLLYAWHNMALQGLDPSEPMRIIRDRFLELARDLGVQFDVASILDEIAARAGQDEAPDYMASRGEYINGRLIAEALGATFVDPADCIRFDTAGRLDPQSYELLAERLQGDGLFVVPGFYGAMPDGSIKTFSRGGSDITGAIVARAIRADLYENWTDVNGFCMADPRIVPDPKRIVEITYAELRELSYMGATVLHDEAIFPVREPGIPIHIRNTWDPDGGGTLIVTSREATAPVCGIAGRTGFTMINLAKTLMNKEKGFGLRVLQVLEDFDISWEHIPTGIDTMSIILRDEELKGRGDTVLEAIRKRVDPDEASITPGLAMLATVGQGMNHHVGVAARLTGALARAGVNIRVIDQGSSEMNIIVGVEESDFPAAMRAVYEEFSRDL
ncbi:MAG TPA: aspartate kinase [Candidatus Hydrogenedentes bacterium]|nr:aspartate kinase [Candidatus Hydrogenedentota bacterium]HOJ67314.1 aspartate kinase [Candidatus Hydrogenedentota bacterium]HOK90385.1 aspartate kinase [Candidatus Hydrogenedentota bacterium]